MPAMSLSLGLPYGGKKKAPFVGALDGHIALLTGVWSMIRLLVSSYTGPLIRLRRVSDNAVMDFYPQADGRVDVAAILTFRGASSCVVVYVYDQFGSNNRTQATAGLQPAWAESVSTFNNAPAMDLQLTGGMECQLNVVKPYSILLVEAPDGQGGARATLSSDSGNKFISSSRGSFWAYVNGDVATNNPSPNSATCEILTAPSAGNLAFFSNGVNYTSASNSSQDWGKTPLGKSGNQNESASAFVAEIVTFNTDLSGAQVTAMQTIFNPATL